MEEQTKIRDFFIQMKLEPKTIDDCKLVEYLTENGKNCKELQNMKLGHIELFFKKCSVPEEIQEAFEHELEAWQKENGVRPIMEKRIELEKRGRQADQITDLNLDNCRSTSIVGLTDEYTALESLSLINVGLTTLKGFPNLPNLKKLELSDNRISNGLNHLTTSSKLTYLNLSGNKIKDLETLKPLESFQKLEVLDLFNNEATTFENYRTKIFAMLPSLKYLDGFDLNEIEASSDGDDDGDDESEVNGNDSDDEVSDEIGEDEDDVEFDEDDEESETEEEDNNHVTLAEVYNDNIEEDNSDWGEEHEVEDDDDEPSDDNEEGDEAANQKEAETPDDAQARGKKRKHDG